MMFYFNKPTIYCGKEEIRQRGTVDYLRKKKFCKLRGAKWGKKWTGRLRFTKPPRSVGIKGVVSRVLFSRPNRPGG